MLTYVEWLEIWEASGHLHERGPRKGQYVMARYGDAGPYRADNVKIIRAEINASEGGFNYGFRKLGVACHCGRRPEQ